MNIKDILDGHLKEVLGENETLSEKRLKICVKCPLYNKLNNFLGGVCSSKLYLNPETGEISSTYKPGFYKGCGCRLNAKTRLEKMKCPAGKW